MALPSYLRVLFQVLFAFIAACVLYVFVNGVMAIHDLYQMYTLIQELGDD